MIKKIAGLILVFIGFIIFFASSFLPLYIAEMERSIIFMIEILLVVIGILVVIVDDD